ncbi:MAG: hypothetical protein KDA49_12030 [Rhodospirillaceae bacterium]|nr:hypothetical protein [Rhodospirillaceae bacterium]
MEDRSDRPTSEAEGTATAGYRADRRDFDDVVAWGCRRMAWAAILAVLALWACFVLPSLVRAIGSESSPAGPVKLLSILLASGGLVASFLAPRIWGSMMRRAGRISLGRGVIAGGLTVIVSYPVTVLGWAVLGMAGGQTLLLLFAGLYIGPLLVAIGAGCSFVVTLWCRARSERLRRNRTPPTDLPGRSAAASRLGRWPGWLLGRPRFDGPLGATDTGARIDRAGRWAMAVLGAGLVIRAGCDGAMFPWITRDPRSGPADALLVCALGSLMAGLLAPRLWAWLSTGKTRLRLGGGIAAGLLMGIGSYGLLWGALALFGRILRSLPGTWVEFALGRRGVLDWTYGLMLHGGWPWVIAAGVLAGLVTLWCQRRLERLGGGGAVDRA